ncbi:MAG: YceH family protein [Colwellia sp.]|nr:YceH family protein [Colwellia sp.]
MITLSAEQCRIIGVMLEKETTTPEQYPLSPNGILIGCNQKSNREPVMSLSEGDIQNLIDELVQINQLMVDQKASSRVNKYFHRFCNTEFGSLQFTPQQRAIICVLLLRGPQTPGELRTRTNRLADFSDVSEVEATLNELQELNGQVLVKKLAREPGKRDSRYVHLLSDFDETSFIQAADTQTKPTSLEDKAQLAERVIELEQQVAALTEQMARLTELLDSE